jgi:FSR family fosmidomycin resistance protein-like MFS transporter
MEQKFQLWLSITMIWLAHLCMDFMIGIWPVYKTLVTLDLAVAGLIASMGMFIGEGLQLYFGVLSDRGFHKHLLILGLVLTATIPFLAYVYHSWILFIFVLSSFIGSGAFHPAAVGLMVGWGPRYKSFFIALFACGGMLGAASSQYMFMKIFYLFGGHTWILVIPIILICLGCVLCPFPKLTYLKEDKQLNFKILWQAIKPYRTELILLYIVQVSLQMIVLSFSFLMPDILQAKGYEEWFCLGGGYFYFVIGSALTSIPIGYYVDKLGYRLILGGIILVSMSLLYVFLFIPNLSLFLLKLVLIGLGGTMGVIVPVIVAGGNSFVPSYASSLVSAIYMGGATCLAGFGPTLAGWIASYFEEQAALQSLQVLGILFMIPMILFYFLPESSPNLEESTSLVEANLLQPYTES